MSDEITPQILIPKKKFFTKKKIIWGSIILVVVLFIGWRINASKNSTANIQTDTVKKQDIKQTVLATGQVVSSTDLDLSFQASGVVQSVNVKEGDKVKQGQVLATLQAGNQAASLTSARGALAQAEANYQKVLDGASSQTIAVAQTTLDNANAALATTQAQQNTAVNNAYSALLNTPFQAVAVNGNVGTPVVTITGYFTGSTQGVYNVVVYNSGSGQKFQVTGLENTGGDVKSSPVALGTMGLFIQFSGATYNNDSWVISIPNTLSSSYSTNYNAYQAAQKARDTAVSSAQSAVTAAQANLNLQKAQARPADLAAAQAQILSAQGQVQAAQAALSNTVIIAPSNGTITSIDVKVGELATAQKEVVILQDVSSLHVEADVSEANIADLQVGQSVDITFDALGPDRHFQGNVQTVNPGATVVSGVVDYKVKASIPSIPDAKPGMTANMTILVNQKIGVLTVPSRAILSHDNKKFVRVIDDSKKKTYHETEVKTGLEADGGLVEITDGLTESEEIVSFIKQ